MIEGWRTQSLGDVCHVYQPETIAQKALRPGPYPVYGANGQIGWHDTANHQESELLLGCRGSVGSIHQTTGPAWINGNAMVVRPLTGVMDRDFLAYALLGGVDISAAITGAAQPQITRTSLSPIPISYPVDISEQRHIVAILDEAFEAIATARVNAEKNLQSSLELFELQREASFAEGKQSWPELRLGDVAEVQSGGTPLVSKTEFWGGDIAWYSSGELNDVKTSEPERFITNDGLSGSNAKLFPRGSLLVGMYDTAALKMSILDREAAFNQAIAGVKPSPRLEMEFLFHAINAQKPALLDLRRGVRQKNLSLGKIKEIVIPVPSTEVQRTVVERLRWMQELSDRLQTAYRRKLITLEELKKALLHQAFTGQLTAKITDKQLEAVA